MQSGSLIQDYIAVWILQKAAAISNGIEKGT